MVKVIGICLLLLVILSVSANAETHGNFEIGKELEQNAAYAKVQLSLEFEIWIFHNSIYGGWLTWFQLPEKGEVLMSAIIYDLYTIGYKLQYDRYYIKLEHLCRHPEKLNHSDKSQSTISVGIEW